MKLSNFLHKRFLFIITGLFFFLLMSNKTAAQVLTEKKYPKNYFQWPVDAVIGIAANFGELRPNHFHMGLDCKTNQKQNIPILAAADGYIAKVKIEPYGFGRAIYINHPSGLTTLYAHLNNFFPELEKYITEQQYKLQSWKVFLDIPSNLFAVTKGQFIAYSGNTGGSQGPHLHFEIRDTKTDKVLNPLLFGLPIADAVAPDVLRLAVYNRNISTYEQSPQFFSLKKVNGVYTIPGGLLKTKNDKVSFGITAYDRYSGSTNRNGIYEAVLFEDEKPVVGFQLDSISYDETRSLNAHIDYKLRSSGGPFVQHVSKLPGNNNSVYKEINGDGVILLTDTSLHEIKIEVNDANGNTSVVQFNVRLAVLPEENRIQVISAKEFYPGFINVFENSNISFYLPEKALYDSVRFRYAEIIPNTGFSIYQLHNTSVPVNGYFPIKIKGTAVFENKMVMHRFSNGKNDFEKAVYENGWYNASFREFGNFQLTIDTLPPVISPLGFRDNMNCSKQFSIKFVVLDNTEDVNFRAELDGQWLRFSNDKGRTFIYVFDEHCLPGEHELKITATDQVGNLTEKIFHLTR